MKRHMKTLILLGVVGVAATAWAVSSAQKTAPSGAPDSAHARPLVAPSLVEVDGDVVQLAFDQGGRVTEVLVNEGDRVAKGQVLARLDDRTARAQLARAEAQLAVAEARRDQAVRGARHDEVRAARADADAARAQAAERELSRGRADRLAASDAISAAQVDTERGQADAARAQADAAEARFALVRAGTRDEAKREAAAAVDEAHAAVDEAKVKLSQTEIVAPRAGVILRRFVEPGEQVTTLPPTTVLTMADLDHLQLRAEIDESDVGRIQLSQTGFATAEAYGDRHFSGHVVRLTGELGRKKVRTDDPRARIDTRVMEVIFVLDEAKDVPLGLRMDLHLAD